MTTDEENILTDLQELIKRKTLYASLLQKANKYFHECKLNEALEICYQLVQLDGNSADAHNKLANVLLLLGRSDEAGNEFKAALLINPELTEARYMLAALGKEEIPAKMPGSVVKKLFDQFADEFDEKLINELGYQAPQNLLSCVSKDFDITSRKIDILDIGCGTGLCGEAFSPISHRMVGIDISSRILEKALEKNVYTDLQNADVLQYMENCNGMFDLVLAGDVFIYIGFLEPVFKLTKQRLNKNGIFAFSIEQHESEDDYLLRKSGRYAHSPTYIVLPQNMGSM